MQKFLRFASGVATPMGTDITGLVPTLAAARLASTRRRIVEALSAAGQDAGGLEAVEAGNRSAWCPETGLALKQLRAGQAGVAGLQATLALLGAGGRGNVVLGVEGQQWLYLDGWLIAASGECRVSGAGEGSGITIESDAGRAVFAFEGGRWTPASGACGPWFAHAGGGLAPRYVTASRLTHHVEGFPWIAYGPGPGHDHASRRDDDVRRIEVIGEGWRIIRYEAPQYAYWVASTASGCLLLDPSGDHQAQSGSCYDHPGLIAIEPPDCPVYCGELLVHECSHQNMLAYMMVAPLTRPGSEETHFSPIKRLHRTVDRVLTGAHAVGNMILYYRTLAAQRTLDPASQERMALLERWFREDYAPALNASQSLTEAGGVFWDSLHGAVEGRQGTRAA